jgi:L-lactate dehydrogenase complex protein LldF
MSWRPLSNLPPAPRTAGHDDPRAPDPDERPAMTTIRYVDIARHRHDGDPLPPLRDRAEAAIGDDTLQGALRVMAGRFAVGRKIRMSDPGMEELRARGIEIRAEGVAHLEENLARLEESLTSLGVVLHHALDGPEAVRIIADIAGRGGVKRIVKSKSMATEEVDLNYHLEQQGIEVIETDLGEWIVQKADERPSHIIAPAVHKTRGDVTKLFSQIAGRELPDRREDLCAFAQHELRDAFLGADMGITGVNFACADTGTLVLVTNEGNGRMSSTLPRIHVAVMPIEKVLARFSDLATMLPLLIGNATGQKLSSYVTFLSGPRREGELDGPEEMHVVVLDNGRRRLLGGPFEHMLRCIRCGACLNVCPVYGTIGGHAYGGTYSGPMGAVLTPLLSGMTEGADLPGASSLCGACTEACPVGIPLHDYLIKLREVADTAARPRGRGRRLVFGAWSRMWSVPSLYRLSARLGRLGPLARRTPAGRAWGEGRELPTPAAQSFHEWWRRERSR